MSAPGTLITSISGIRGIVGDGLDAAALVKYAAAFGTWCRHHAPVTEQRPLVVVGRDARASGDVCARLVRATLCMAGCDVIDAGLTPTPTVEMAVLAEEAAGGVVVSASHNPAEWNALKLLNEKGEFLTPEQVRFVFHIADDNAAQTAPYDALGDETEHDFLPYHIDEIAKLGFIDLDALAARDFTLVVDGINSVGALALPALLTRLGVDRANLTVLNAAPNGYFAHPPEPRPEHLQGLIEAVQATGADLGLAVDPDVDRLALVDNEGRYVNEELTQVIAADFLWGLRAGPFVTNLSSSRAIDDIAEKHGQPVHRTKVGEINVVQRMQEVGAVLGGEGNGGVILPELHYGRDALVGTAMILQHPRPERRYARRGARRHAALRHRQAQHPAAGRERRTAVGRTRKLLLRRRPLGRGWPEGQLRGELGSTCARPTPSPSCASTPRPKTRPPRGR